MALELVYNAGNCKDICFTRLSVDPVADASRRLAQLDPEAGQRSNRLVCERVHGCSNRPMSNHRKARSEARAGSERHHGVPRTAEMSSGEPPLGISANPPSIAVVLSAEPSRKSNPIEIDCN